MAADPALDRIAASFEDALLHANPASRAYFAAATDRFIADQLAVYDGDPAELGAVLLNLHRSIATLYKPSKGRRRSRSQSLDAEQVLTGLQFYLGHGGVQLYLRRHPAAQAPQ
jgi:hypothetical protein